MKYLGESQRVIKKANAHGESGNELSIRAFMLSGI
jgi:hypothetical protein